MNQIVLGTNRAQPAEPLMERPVPRWAERLAHAIPLLVLPSGLWRLAIAFGFSMGMLNDAGQVAVVRGWPATYIAVISLLSEAIGLTAFGLVRPWGGGCSGVVSVHRRSTGASDGRDRACHSGFGCADIDLDGGLLGCVDWRPGTPHG